MLVQLKMGAHTLYSVMPVIFGIITDAIICPILLILAVFIVKAVVSKLH